MKFTCLSSHLNRALSSAERFTGKHATLPILGNVLLESTRASLRVVATNLEYAIRVDVPGDGGREGSITVPAKITGSFIQSLPEGRVVLEEKQRHLWVSAAGRETKINAVSSDDFPLLPRVTPLFSFSIDGALFSRAISRVLPAVSLSEFKPALTGIFLGVDQQSVRLAATDVFRLAETIVPLSGKNENGPRQLIIPRLVAHELLRLLADEHDEVRVLVGDGQAVFEKDGLFVVSRLVEGAFPEYQGIIPKQFDATAVCKREDIADAARGAGIFSSRLQDVRCEVFDDSIRLSAKNPDVGEYKTEIPAAVTGKPIDVSFNVRYFLDGLHALDGDECELCITPEKSLLRTPSDQSFLYMVAPIRLT